MSTQARSRESFNLKKEFRKTKKGISWWVIIGLSTIFTGGAYALFRVVQGGFIMLSGVDLILLAVFAITFYVAMRYILARHFMDHLQNDVPFQYKRIALGIVLYFVGKTGVFVVVTAHLPAFSLGMWVMAYVFYVFTILGVTIGYHRLITHRAFRAGRVFGGILLGGGAMALEGFIGTWATKHRIHHARTEIEEQDPHTTAEGFWWAHILWLWFPYEYSKKLWNRYAAGFDDSDPIIRDHKYYNRIAAALGFLIPALTFGIPAMFFGETASLAHGFIEGGKAVVLVGFLRLTIVYNITFAVNSWAHKWGPHPYQNSVTGDSRDTWILAIFSFGETLQNIHHLMQDKALYWVKPHYIDMSGAILVLLEHFHDTPGFRWIGLPHDLKLIGSASKKYMREHPFRKLSLD